MDLDAALELLSRTPETPLDVAEIALCLARDEFPELDVEAIINKEGRVEQVKVIKGLPMGLSDAAEEAVKGWRFRPGTLNGQPVEVIFNLTVNFTLG